MHRITGLMSYQTQPLVNNLLTTVSDSFYQLLINAVSSVFLVHIIIHILIILLRLSLSVSVRLPSTFVTFTFAECCLFLRCVGKSRDIKMHQNADSIGKRDCKQLARTSMT